MTAHFSLTVAQNVSLRFIIIIINVLSGTHETIEKNFNCVWDAERDAARVSMIHLVV